MVIAKLPLPDGVAILHHVFCFLKRFSQDHAGLLTRIQTLHIDQGQNGLPQSPSLHLQAIMMFRIALAITAALQIFNVVSAESAPEITSVVDGYNVIVKLPCIGCPFLYQDTSKGNNGPWTERKDKSALVS